MLGTVNAALFVCPLSTCDLPLPVYPWHPTPPQPLLLEHAAMGNKQGKDGVVQGDVGTAATDGGDEAAHTSAPAPEGSDDVANQRKLSAAEEELFALAAMMKNEGTKGVGKADETLGEATAILQQ